MRRIWNWIGSRRIRWNRFDFEYIIRKICLLICEANDVSEQVCCITVELYLVQRLTVYLIYLMTSQIKALEMELSSVKEENKDLHSHNEAILQQIAETEAKLIEQVTPPDS